MVADRPGVGALMARARTDEIELALEGPGGEPIELWRTINGHGVTSLPPMAVDDAAKALTVTLTTPAGPPRTVTVAHGRPGYAAVKMHGPAPSAAECAAIERAIRHVLRFDEDLSPFYALAKADPALAWATAGAGRMTRCQTVFEDVVKTICTTNCAWSATVRMVNALVAHLGEPAAHAPEEGSGGRAFPTPAAMAAADEAFYREQVRCGYRGAYLRKLAHSVVDDEVDLEALGQATPEEISDDEMAKQLVALPGVGPYAAAHIMMMLGRYSRLIFDSWTRPTYAALTGETLADAEIAARFAPYGRFAGLAFWLTITKDWA
jgi:N-glycosylase/DNA lyase